MGSRRELKFAALALSWLRLFAGPAAALFPSFARPATAAQAESPGGAREGPLHTPPVPVPAPGSPGSAAVGIARGTLAQASPDELVLDVPGHAPMRLAIDPAAPSRLDGSPVAPGQIPLGADVEARYRVEGERVIATRIDARRPGPRP